MKQFREALDDIKGLRHIYEEMDLASSVGRIALLESIWLTDTTEIEIALDEVEKFVGYISQDKGTELLALQLEEVVNISGSIEILRQKSGTYCNDIDLFEIKKLALIDSKINAISQQYQYQLTPRPSLQGVLDILDPRGEYLPSFYIEDGFDPTIKELRNQIERSQDEAELATLNDQLAKSEEQVRIQLTRSLSPYAQQLSEVLTALAHDTVLLAKAKWAIKCDATRPIPIERGGTTEITDLIHRIVANELSLKGKRFQPVSITFDAEPTLISGANMGGKSVLLHSVAVAQALMQYGCYVPAQQARIAMVDEILYSSGDGENMRRGLSSFGAEMIRLNEIIKIAKSDTQVLAIIDEPARTTNPEEGYALVSGLVKILERYHVRALITTHYSGIASAGRRWRVKGFAEKQRGTKEIASIKVAELGDLMDYSLVPDTEESVPREAFRIAELLGVDKEFLDLSNKSFRSI